MKRKFPRRRIGHKDGRLSSRQRGIPFLATTSPPLPLPLEGTERRAD